MKSFNDESHGEKNISTYLDELLTVGDEEDFNGSDLEALGLLNNLGMASSVMNTPMAFNIDRGAFPSLDFVKLDMLLFNDLINDVQLEMSEVVYEQQMNFNELITALRYLTNRKFVVPLSGGFGQSDPIGTKGKDVIPEDNRVVGFRERSLGMLRERLANKNGNVSVLLPLSEPDEFESGPISKDGDPELDIYYIDIDEQNLSSSMDIDQTDIQIDPSKPFKDIRPSRKKRFLKRNLRDKKIDPSLPFLRSSNPISDVERIPEDRILQSIKGKEELLDMSSALFYLSQSIQLDEGEIIDDGDSYSSEYSREIYDGDIEQDIKVADSIKASSKDPMAVSKITALESARFPSKDLKNPRLSGVKKGPNIVKAINMLGSAATITLVPSVNEEQNILPPPSHSYSDAANLTSDNIRGINELRVPAFQQGGFVEKTGLAYVHEGEVVIPKEHVAKVLPQGSPTGGHQGSLPTVPTTSGGQQMPSPPPSNMGPMAPSLTGISQLQQALNGMDGVNRVKPVPPNSYAPPTPLPTSSGLPSQQPTPPTSVPPSGGLPSQQPSSPTSLPTSGGIQSQQLVPPTSSQLKFYPRPSDPTPPTQSTGAAPPIEPGNNSPAPPTGSQVTPPPSSANQQVSPGDSPQTAPTGPGRAGQSSPTDTGAIALLSQSAISVNEMAPSRANVVPPASPGGTPTAPTGNATPAGGPSPGPSFQQGPSGSPTGNAAPAGGQSPAPPSQQGPSGSPIGNAAPAGGQPPVPPFQHGPSGAPGPASPAPPASAVAMLAQSVFQMGKGNIPIIGGSPAGVAPFSSASQAAPLPGQPIGARELSFGIGARASLGNAIAVGNAMQSPLARLKAMEQMGEGATGALGTVAAPNMALGVFPGNLNAVSQAVSGNLPMGPGVGQLPQSPELSKYGNLLKGMADSMGGGNRVFNFSIGGSDVNLATGEVLSSISPNIPTLKGKVVNGFAKDITFEFSRTGVRPASMTPLSKDDGFFVSGKGLVDEFPSTNVPTRPLSMPAVRDANVSNVYGGQRIKPAATVDGSTYRRLPTYPEDGEKEASNVILKESLEVLRSLKDQHLEKMTKVEREKAIDRGVDSKLKEINESGNDIGIGKEELYKAVEELLKKEAKRYGLVL